MNKGSRPLRSPPNACERKPNLLLKWLAQALLNFSSFCQLLKKNVEGIFIVINKLQVNINADSC
jgi:hypothetical protein